MTASPLNACFRSINGECALSIHLRVFALGDRFMFVASRFAIESSLRLRALRSIRASRFAVNDTGPRAQERSRGEAGLANPAACNACRHSVIPRPQQYPGPDRRSCGSIRSSGFTIESHGSSSSNGHKNRQ